MVGNLVQGNRLAMAQGRDIGLMDEDDISRRVSPSNYFLINSFTVWSSEKNFNILFKIY